MDLICDRPRKVLGYRTANEVFREITQLDNLPVKIQLL